MDEPELGMGNSYIDTDIRPLISSLAKQRKYVVIATHNANIAVRTLPYTSIFRTHENGEYKTYVGNPFDDMSETRPARATEADIMTETSQRPAATSRCTCHG